MNSSTVPPRPSANARPTTKLKPGPNALSVKAGTAGSRPNPKPTGSPGATNLKASAGTGPGPLASNGPKPTGAPQPRPSPTTQIGPGQLDAIHRKVIQTIEGAEKAMATTRANVQTAQSSKEDRNKVVAKANEVVDALLAPSRHVVNLLSALGALFPPCKLVSSTLAPLIKREVGQHEKDVRVAIVHFDLARALVHVGSLNRKSRPTKSLGDPLAELMKNFKGLIQEFGQFCEAYYETRAPESSLKHLLHWKSNKDGLNGFADRVARLKNDLTSLLSQQAVPHPGKHSDYLAQIESRLAENRSFYATIRDANEEIAEAFLSNQGGGASARLVQDGSLLKQLAGVVGEGVTQGIASALKKTTVTTLKQVAKTLPDANQKTPQRGIRASFASKLQGTLDKLGSGPQQKAQVGKKPPGPHGPHQPVHTQAINTHVPARGHHSGHQQMKATSRNIDKLQTSRVQVQPSPDTTIHPEFQEYGLYREVADGEGNIEEVFVGVIEQPGDMEGTDEREPGHYSLDVEEYEYPDGDLEGDGDGDGDQEFFYLQEGEEAGNGLAGDREYAYEVYSAEDGDENKSEEEGADQGQEENAGSEPGGDEEGGQEPSFVQDDGDENKSEEEEADCGDQVQEDAGSEPGGDDEGYQEPHRAQDDDDDDDSDDDSSSSEDDD